MRLGVDTPAVVDTYPNQCFLPKDKQSADIWIPLILPEDFESDKRSEIILGIDTIIFVISTLLYLRPVVAVIHPEFGLNLRHSLRRELVVDYQ
jgi:hypothetical protein